MHMYITVVLTRQLHTYLSTNANEANLPVWLPWIYSHLVQNADVYHIGLPKDSAMQEIFLSYQIHTGPAFIG